MNLKWPIDRALIIPETVNQDGYYAALNGVISTEGISETEALERAKNWPGLLGVDYVKEVTHKEAFLWDPKDEQSADFKLVQGGQKADPRQNREPLPPADVPIVAYDFGMKYNIRRRLRQHGARDGLLVGRLDDRDEVVPALGPEDLMDLEAALFVRGPVLSRPLDRVLGVLGSLVGESVEDDVVRHGTPPFTEPRPMTALDHRARVILRPTGRAILSAANRGIGGPRIGSAPAP